MSRPGRQREKSANELIEEAVHVLRTASPVALASYYLGTLPFVLGMWYFWADMSRSPFAHQHLAEAALGLSGLFLWMKYWQAIFARQLRATIAHLPVPPLTLAGYRRILVNQIALQPTAFFMLPLAAIPTLPMAWVFAFYQNLTVMPESAEVEMMSLAKKATRQAALWPKQNHLLLAILTGFALFVFLNWATVCFSLPHVMKMLFGVESVWTRSGLSLLNTTFFAVVVGLTYLCVDPIIKTVYALRCFMGDSLHSGEDLKAELRQLRPGALVVALLCLSMVSTAWCQEADLPSSPPRSSIPLEQEASGPEADAATLSAPLLDRAIQDVLQQRKFTWRMPREKIPKPDMAGKGLIGRFLERVAQLFETGWQKLKQWIENVAEWLERWLRKLTGRQRGGGAASSGYGWMVWLEMLVYVLIVAAVSALGLLVYRAWRNRHPEAAAVASEPVMNAPDLRDDNVGAEQLPEDGWTKLARELWERGELRLALRAFYLASLAGLAGRHLIQLGKFKSNRDYERELRRRGHALPELVTLFGENVSVFDRIWYGLHEINHDLVSQFAANVEHIKHAAAGVGGASPAPTPPEP